MQQEITFAAYVIDAVSLKAVRELDSEGRERTLRERKKPQLDFAYVFKSPTTIVTATADFLGKLKEVPIDHSDEKDMLELTHLTPDFPNQRVSGLVSRGSYGKQRRVRDRLKQSIVESLGPEKAVMDSYFFDLHFSSVYKVGLLICQVQGVSGIASLFTGAYRTHLRELNPDVNIRVERYSPPDYMASLIAKHAEIKSLTFTRNKPPAESLQAMQEFGILNEVGSLQYTIVPKRDKSFTGLMKVIQDHLVMNKGKKVAGLGGFESLVPAGIDPTSLRITLLVGGKHRSFRLEELTFGHATFEDQLEIDDQTGLPTTNALTTSTKAIAVDIFNDLFPDDEKV
ncbi:MAG: hypothetical protein ABL962_13470 [Fimbriimonadaceae bacterium]